MSAQTVRSYERETNAEALAAAGRKGSATRHSAASYARSVAKRWPALTAAQRAEVSAILSPLVGRTEAGR